MATKVQSHLYRHRTFELTCRLSLAPKLRDRSQLGSLPVNYCRLTYTAVRIGMKTRKNFGTRMMS